MEIGEFLVRSIVMAVPIGIVIYFVARRLGKK
jgi:hypothetical protein